MSKEYFDLSSDIQKALIDKAADQLNISDVAIEKDLWICWILQQLFDLPLSMVLKGGTSLSKAYNLINRFSEDVDITLDPHSFQFTVDLEKATRSSLKKISEELQTTLENCIQKTILPHLRKCILRFSNQEKFSIDWDEEESLRFYYPSVLSHHFLTSDGDFLLFENENSYLRDHILIEFGARNSIEPNEKHIITPLLSQITFEEPLNFSKTEVDVLSIIRTFWEKTTLIHVECHRKRLRNNPDRLSRHWYDLAMLKKAGIDKEALSQWKILEDVVKHKKAFFNASYANYDDCLNNKFRLIPDDADKKSLERDYESMKNFGMFSEEPMSFDEILNLLNELEDVLKTSRCV